MFVKQSPDGRIFVADRANRRLAGSFTSADDARQWIADKGGSAENGPDRCVVSGRQPRTNTSLLRAEVQRIVPALLSVPMLSDDDREFVLRLQAMRQRTYPHLRLTDRQVKRWHLLTRKLQRKSA